MQKALRLAVCLWLTASAFACKDESIKPISGSAVDHAKLCKDGGAELNAASNACVCSGSQLWNGAQCVPATVTNPPPAAIAKDTHDGAGFELKPEPKAAATEPKPAATPSLAQRLKQACKRAQGEYLEKDNFCICPKGGVLVGARCRILPGYVTDDACLRAVARGRWRSGLCQCEKGLVFSPARGGCVERFQGDLAVLRRVCESSANRGKWDAAFGRCSCPAGRVWREEACQVQQTLTSRDVCESEYNHGQWQADYKRCLCPAGFQWIDQSCKAQSALSPKQVCESEAMRGQWQDAKATCLCPAPTHWQAARMACL